MKIFSWKHFLLLGSHYLQVFANPDLEYQKDRIFFYSMMFLVIGAGSAIAMFFQVNESPSAHVN
jgi:hypothetical protein